MNRRRFIKSASAGAMVFSSSAPWTSAEELEPIRAEVKKQHDQTVRRLQQWIHQPSIAAENRGRGFAGISTWENRLRGRLHDRADGPKQRIPMAHFFLLHGQ